MSKQTELDRQHTEITTRRAQIERQQQATRDPAELKRLDRELAEVGERWIRYCRDANQALADFWEGR